MEIPPFAEAVARLCARDGRYAPEAFVFLNEGLVQTLKQVQEKEKKPRQISGAELADGLRQHALAQFGPLALTVLNRWGVRTTRDFGEIVFLLLEAGLLGKTEEDKLEDFDDLYDFDAAFRAPFRPKPCRRAPKTSAPKS
ncbi:MAG: Minf_1886 family protein [Kiritimatiellia bacterium]